MAPSQAPETALDALNEQQRRFVRLYVADPKRNASRAYLSAGYEAAPGASAAAASSRLLREVKVSEAVKELQNQLGGDDLLSRVVARLEAIAFADLSDLISWDGSGKVAFVPSSGLTPQASAAVAEIQDQFEEAQLTLPGLEEAVDGHKIKRRVKMHDPLKALDMLVRLKGGYAPEKVENSFADGLEIVVKRFPEGGGHGPAS